MKNWKTTAAGVLGAIGLVIFQLLSAGTVDAKTLITAAIVAGIGALAKDHDVIGGTIVQSSLPLLNTALTEVEKAKPSPLLTEIHGIVSELSANQASTSAAASEKGATQPTV